MRKQERNSLIAGNALFNYKLKSCHEARRIKYFSYGFSGEIISKLNPNITNTMKS